MLKSTYGTGCFAVLNTGPTPVASNNKLLTTIAYQLGGKRTYALEGSIFVAGAAVQWLRDNLQIVASAEATGALAAAADPTQEVILVPAFVGLGAPYWRPDARGALFGLTRGSGPAELGAGRARQRLLSDRGSAHRHAGRLAAGAETRCKFLRVDGGMAASDWTMQRLADLTGCIVDRPHIKETTALGAAYLAGLRGGFFPEPDRFAESLAAGTPVYAADGHSTRERKLAGWSSAVRRLLA